MLRFGVFLLFALGSTQCTKIYYSTWEFLGKQKRDLLKDQVEGLTNDQEAVNEEFKDALSHLRDLYGGPETKLSSAYDQLAHDLNDAKAKSEALSNRIIKVRAIAHDLFDEWDSEIHKLKNPKYREDSRRKLRLTRQKFIKLDGSMERAKKDLAPVLASLEEQVIYLKHNLNAQALGNIQGEVRSIEGDYKSLTTSLQTSITESRSFISSLSND